MMRSSVRSVLRKLGYEIRRAKPMSHIGAFEAQRWLLRARAVETVFDVGASLGHVTARYRRLFPDSRIHAFEPTPDTFSRLQERFRDDPGVTVVRCALADRCGVAELHINEDPDTNSLLPTAGSIGVENPGLATRVSTRTTTPIDVSTLDRYCSDRGIPRVDVLKIDVQGAELKVLQGAEGLLGAGAVQLVYSEVLFTDQYDGQAYMHELAAHLASFGYQLYRLYNLKYTEAGRLNWGDAIFLPRGILGPTSDSRR